ncbi:hypothetical protein RZO55_23120 [Clostridium boliviensis]|uniref:Uncharacterized protein n=1 Tax=Clostridium boliviensis TaxID=318465 RepID=A0ABU4GSB5_9CLOT|nr:hypothetical protein [Clostridium boliviensis]MDW2800464.1 hypothetical protein [Clostridium boliviensis]
MKKKEIFAIIILAILLCTVILVLKNERQSPYDFLKYRKNYGKSQNATEFIYQADIGNKQHLIFYINENGNLASAIIKKGIFNYNILNISSEILLNGSDPYNFHFSSYNKGQNWIYWGSIQDKNVKKVLIDEAEAKLVDTNYDFRICYLLGTREVKSSLPNYKIIY